MARVMKKIGVKEFEKIIGSKISNFIAKKINKAKLVYSPLTTKERDGVILKITNILLDNSIPFSGEHRKNQWEKGWEENLLEYKKEQNSISLVPKYYYKYKDSKYKIGKINGEFFKFISPNFDFETAGIIVYWAIETYLKNVTNIFDFGCGTGHNLLKMREVNKTANITGLDWVSSSQKTVRQIAKNYNDKKMFARKFDYFNPDYSLKLPQKSGIFTMESLEQTGNNYKKFIDYVLKNRPEIVVNIEPITELLDENKLVDNLTIKYARKRNYLNGYLDYLRKLEKQGKIKVHKAKRTYIGDTFNESKSIIVWSVK